MPKLLSPEGGIPKEDIDSVLPIVND